VPPHTQRRQERRVESKPLWGATWPTSNNFASCTPSSGNNNNGYDSSRRFSRRKQPTRSLTRAHTLRHATYVITSWKMPRPKHPWPFTGPVKTSPQQRSYYAPCRSLLPPKGAESMVKFEDSWNVLWSSRPRAHPLGFGSSPHVTEPPKSLGPPTVVLVQRTSDNPAGATDHLTSSVSKFLTFPKSVLPVTQTLQFIGDTKVRKQLQ
jgi:hypothetical protein